MIFCPACGMQNYPGSTHCQRCQASFPNLGQQPQQPQWQPQQSQPMQPMQGGPMQGYQMAAAAPMGAPMKKSNTGLIIGVVVGLLVLGGGVAAALLLAGGKSKKAQSSSESASYGGETSSGGPGGGSAVVAAIGSGSAAPAVVAAPAPSEALAALTTLRDHACACMDYDCAMKAQEELEAWSTRYAATIGAGAEAEQVSQAAADAAECLMKAMGAAAEAPPPTVATGGTATSTGIAECDAYASAVEQYLSCDKVPQAARDGARQGLDAMKGAWGQLAGVPDEAKQQIGDACRQAVDAIKQGADAMGCPINVTVSGSATTTTTATTPTAAKTYTPPPKDLPSCQKYFDVTMALMKCDKMPESAKDGLTQGLDAMSTAWTSYGNMGADIKAQIDDGCKQADDALEQAAASIGCK